MKKIMLVDDSSTLLTSMENILKRAGYEIQTAKNGQAALDILNKGYKPDLIITDLNMPIMDGITFIKETRKKPGYKFIPILMLTTESQQQKRMEAKKAGATGWLVKPVKAQDLLAIIKKVLP